MNPAQSVGDNKVWPRNTDRAQWAAFALVRFAEATGLGDDLQADPQTVVADLLADLMHWCDAQRTSGLNEAIDFESALLRARRHHREEIVERPGRLEEDVT
jgi:hypothetical protein